MDHTERIGLVIKRLSHQIKREVDRQISSNVAADVTGLQGHVIGFLRERSQHEDVFQKDIEAEFRIRRSTASGILGLMEKNGLITREPVGYDARLKKLSLTPKAIRIFEKVDRELEAVEARLAHGLTSEEIETFFGIMAKIRRNLD